VTTFFELRAKGGNPDEEIALAHQSIDAAKRSLAKGNVDESQTHCDAADAHIKNANAIIEDTLAARVGVGATITNIEQARAQLLSDCESGNEPLQQLKSDFASVNFQDVAKNIETAKTTARKVEGVIAQAAAQYFKQDFLAAKKLLDDLLHDLTAAKTGVGQISLRLNELTEKRAKLLANVAKTGGTLETVGAKLQSNSSYVSSTTKSNYEKLQQQQKSLSQVSEGGSAINWLAMYMLWEAFNSGASTVSSHIDSDRSSYEASQRASEAAAASAASSYTTSSFSIDTSSSSSMGGSGGGNY
jgi:chromosome segregation ATPase